MLMPEALLGVGGGECSEVHTGPLAVSESCGPSIPGPWGYSGSHTGLLRDPVSRYRGQPPWQQTIWTCLGGSYGCAVALTKVYHWPVSERLQRAVSFCTVAEGLPQAPLAEGPPLAVIVWEHVILLLLPETT
ncbi:hypothetical protein SKAU_G00207060 [Synaphobranchus kaupii]|uniref:Uncharacterized protein n=1 Tax=Synaphobranchus kaupii TaxID=118154 RepID=A0A9Q1F818_SYNKA|nr:hypothetical protein SKAU_G00207060 [Synaphobranchus kaupii]